MIKIQGNYNDYSLILSNDVYSLHAWMCVEAKYVVHAIWCQYEEYSEKNKPYNKQYYVAVDATIKLLLY